MKRRTLLLGAPLCCALAPPLTPQQALLGVFGDLARARSLGRIYIAGLPRPPAAWELSSPVWHSLSGRGAIRDQLAELIRCDFAAGRLECLDGWLLSLTEARLCGLAALG